MSKLTDALAILRANLVHEDQNFRACMVDDAIGRIRTLETELQYALTIHSDCMCRNLKARFEAHLGSVAQKIGEPNVHD